MSRPLSDAQIDELKVLANALQIYDVKHVVALSELLDAVGLDHRTDRERTLPHPVLVADDFPGHRDNLAAMLRNAGFLVCTASNGLEAVVTACEVRPVVIVMDLIMPVLNGVEATRLIKAIKVLRDVSVIAHTVIPSNDLSSTGPLFTTVLQKPASSDMVVAAVQRSVPS